VIDRNLTKFLNKYGGGSFFNSDYTGLNNEERDAIELSRGLYCIPCFKGQYISVNEPGNKIRLNQNTSVTLYTDCSILEQSVFDFPTYNAERNYIWIAMEYFNIPIKYPYMCSIHTDKSVPLEEHFLTNLIEAYLDDVSEDVYCYGINVVSNSALNYFSVEV